MSLSKIKEWKIFQLGFAIVFFASGLIVNLIQCILYYSVRVISKTLYRKINYYLCYTLYAELVFLGEWWSGMDILLYSSKEDFKYFGKEHAYCVMNHAYEIDWVVGWILCERINVLGNCKAYAKKAIQYLPIIGWAWKFSEFVFLERDFEKDKNIISRQIVHLANHPDPIWLLIFPEGTRLTPVKHAASISFAKEKGLPEFNYHLLPRTKGFIASLPAMHGKIDAIYDCEVAFDQDADVKPTVLNLLLGRKVQAHLAIKRIPFDKVPKTEEAQTKFLYDMYARKDLLQAGFHENKDFFARLEKERVKPFRLARRYFSLINLLAWVIVLIVPMFVLLIRWLINGDFIPFSIGVGLIIIFHVFLNKALRMSDINRASSYGTSPKKTKTN